MLSPKRTKYRKRQRRFGKLKQIAGRGNRISFGDYGLQSLEGRLITNRQIRGREGEMSPETTVRIDKNTLGRTGETPLIFSGPRMRFGDMAREEAAWSSRM